MAATILIVEDEYAVARGIQYALQQEGYQVAVARSGEEGLDFATREAPDLVVLDVRLPGIDGFEVLRRLRMTGSKAPVLILTARDDEVDKVIGLELGADDYVTKPFGIDELLARLRAVSRRAETGEETPRVDLGNVSVDLAASRVTRHDGDTETDVRLTPTEWRLLKVLLRYPGKLVTQRQLLAEVWGPAYTTETHYLRLYMTQLRRKLEPNPARPRHLVTESGMGYRFEP